MCGEKVSWSNVIKFAGAFVAFLIGSGFATGQEILQYFTAYGMKGLLAGLFTLICLVYVGGDFIATGFRQRFSNTNDIYRYYCGRYIGGFYDYFAIAFLYMSYIVMVAGAGATLAQYYGLPVYAGCVGMAFVSAFTVTFGLGRIVDVIGTIGPAIVLFAIGIGFAAILKNPEGIAQGARMIEAAEVKMTKVGTNWLTSGMSYVGFSMLWLAAFLAAMGQKANSAKEAVIGTTLGAAGFVAGIVIMMLGLLANIDAVAMTDIPSLILAERIYPPIATIFSIIIMGGIYTTSVPLLWSVSARFSAEKTRKSYLLTAGLAASGCAVSLLLPFQRIVNIIYGINGYVGILLILFMIVKTVRNMRKPA